MSLTKEITGKILGTREYYGPHLFIDSGPCPINLARVLETCL
jgi:hypothetical protein